MACHDQSVSDSRISRTLAVIATQLHQLTVLTSPVRARHEQVGIARHRQSTWTTGRQRPLTYRLVQSYSVYAENSVVRYVDTLFPFARGDVPHVVSTYTRDGQTTHEDEVHRGEDVDLVVVAVTQNVEFVA